MFLYGALTDEIKRKGKTREEFASDVGINVATLSLKLSNKSEWKQGEMIAACDSLGIPYEKIPVYFFAQ